MAFLSIGSSFFRLRVDIGIVIAIGIIGDSVVLFKRRMTYSR